VLVTSLVLLDHDYVQQMKAIVASGELGRIVNLRILAGHGLTLLNMMPEGFFTRSEAVGGVLMDICHPLYITTYLLGEPETVYARFAHVTNRELEDSASVLMDFADGAHVSVDVSFVMKGAPSMQIEVIGTEGSVFYRGGAEPASKGPSTGTVFEKRMDYPNRITNLVLGECPGPTVGAWAEHVATGTRADSNIGYSLGLSLITEAAYQSAATGLPVSVSTLRD
jgi:1,5-anhydro-D-fructose reductase (1,5-anhydro-D-mannitol-forming)